MVLHNARIYTEGSVSEAGVAVDAGKIVKVAKEPNLPFASERLDLNGCLMLPGLIDAHVHLRAQLQSYEEDFFSGTTAAVTGGFTTVLDMPNNKPVTMNPASLRERMQSAEGDIVANVGFYSAFPESLDEISKIAREGAVGFKLYLNSQIGGIDVNDDEALSNAFNRVGKVGVTVAVHAEDKGAVEAISKAEQRLGHKELDSYLKAHTAEIEAKAVERILRIAGDSDVNVHFCHVSSNEAVTILNDARRNKLKVSCEVTPHNLLLTSDDLRKQGTMLLTDPPLRSIDVVNGLWNAVRNRQIDIIASDHAPHLISEKRAESIWDVKPGIPGLETTLPLLLTEVNEGHLSIGMLVRLMAEKPAEVFHLNHDGALKEGYNANITVVDMHRKGRIDASKFCSKAKYSPFDGWVVKGMPVKTFVNGRLAMDEGEAVAEAGAGRVLRSGE